MTELSQVITAFFFWSEPDQGPQTTLTGFFQKLDAFHKGTPAVETG